MIPVGFIVVGTTVLDCTVTSHFVIFPLLVLATIFVFPACNAVIFPLLTEATDGFELVHVIVLFVTLVGAIVAVNVSLEPTFNVVLVLFKVIPVATTCLILTSTVVVVVFPLYDLAVITEVPSFNAVIFPLLTETTFGFELVHVIVVLIALVG